AYIGLQDPEPELGETLQYAGENKVRHGHHVVHRKPDDMVESAERPLISLERTKGRGPYMARLAMYRDRKIEIAGKLPQGIVFGFVQPFARGQQGIARRDGAESFHRAPSFGNHRCSVAGRQSSGELEAGRGCLWIISVHDMVGPGHR